MPTPIRVIEAWFLDLNGEFRKRRFDFDRSRERIEYTRFTSWAINNTRVFWIIPITASDIDEQLDSLVDKSNDETVAN